MDGWSDSPAVGNGQSAIAPGTKIVLKPFVEVDGVYSPPNAPVTDYVMKGIIDDVYTPSPIETADPLYPASAGGAPVFNPNAAFPRGTGFNWLPVGPLKILQDYSHLHTWFSAVQVRIDTIVGSVPTPTPPFNQLKFVVDLFEEPEKLFEFKFPRFSYRYKYKDGEYSPFAPFTQVAFKPGSFDYHPRKGFNLGMRNNINKIKLSGFINSETPKDVVSVDILFKEEPSPNIYVVDTLYPDESVVDGIGQTATSNNWNIVKFGGTFDITSETISSVLPSNQLLRPWDNVPRKALAQEVTGSRIVYANYEQNYDLKTHSIHFLN